MTSVALDATPGSVALDLPRAAASTVIVTAVPLDDTDVGDVDAVALAVPAFDPDAGDVDAVALAVPAFDAGGDDYNGFGDDDPDDDLDPSAGDNGDWFLEQPLDLRAMTGRQVAAFLRWYTPLFKPVAALVVEQGLSGDDIAGVLDEYDDTKSLDDVCDMFDADEQLAGMLVDALLEEDAAHECTGRIVAGHYDGLATRCAALPRGRDHDRLADARRALAYTHKEVAASRQDAKALCDAHRLVAQAHMSLGQPLQAAEQLSAAAKVAAKDAPEYLADLQKQDLDARQAYHANIEKINDQYLQEGTTFDDLKRRAGFPDDHPDKLLPAECVSLLCSIVNQGDNALEELMQHSRQGAEQPAQSSHAYILLGETGQGKSTCVNYANGCKYTKTDSNTLVPVEGAVEATKVGTTGDSETFIPQGVRVTADNGVDHFFFDCPGFGDNGGPMIAIGNAVNVRNVMVRCTSLQLGIVYLMKTGRVETDTRRKSFGEVYEFVMGLFNPKEAFLDYVDRVSIVFNGRPTSNRLNEFDKDVQNYCSKHGVPADIRDAWVSIARRHIIVDPLDADGREAFLESLYQSSTGFVDTQNSKLPFKVVLASEEKNLLTSIYEQIDASIDSLQGACTFEAIRLVRRNWEVVAALADVIEDDVRLQTMFREKMPRILRGYAEAAFAKPLYDMFEPPPVDVAAMLEIQAIERKFEKFVHSYPTVEALQVLYDKVSSQAEGLKWICFENLVKEVLANDVRMLIEQVMSATEPWTAVGVRRTATPEQARNKFIKRVKLLHPDKCSAPGAKEAFQRLSDAFEHIKSGSASPWNPANDGAGAVQQQQSAADLASVLCETIDIDNHIQCLQFLRTSDDTVPVQAEACEKLWVALRQATWIFDFAYLERVGELVPELLLEVRASLLSTFAPLCRRELGSLSSQIVTDARSVADSLENDWPDALNGDVGTLQDLLAQPTVDALMQALEIISAVNPTNLVDSVRRFASIAESVQQVVDALEQAGSTNPTPADVLEQCGGAEALQLSSVNNQLRMVCNLASSASASEKTLTAMECAYATAEAAMRSCKTFEQVKKAIDALNEDLSDLVDAVAVGAATAKVKETLAKTADKYRRDAQGLVETFFHESERLLHQHLKSGNVDDAVATASMLSAAPAEASALLDALKQLFSGDVAKLWAKAQESVESIASDTAVMSGRQYDDRFRFVQEYFSHLEVLKNLEGDKDAATSMLADADALLKQLDKVVDDIKTFSDDDERLAPQLIGVYACASASDQLVLQTGLKKNLQNWLASFKDPVRIGAIGSLLLKYEGEVQYAAQFLADFPQFKRIQVKLHKQYANISHDEFFAKLVNDNANVPSITQLGQRMRGVVDKYLAKTNGKCSAGSPRVHRNF